MSNENEYDSRIPGIKNPKQPADVRINGPHEVYEGKVFDCEAGCATKLRGGDKFYFLGKGSYENKSKRVCVSCAKLAIY